MVRMDEWDVEVMYDVVRRAAPFASLPRSAFEAVLDMLAGRYPSDEFAELRPRLVWDRVGGTLTGRPGAQRLAVTSGGTIPDRGLFGVFLVGDKKSRVGELDEEMVYESRVGDVFTLGSTSWRIEDITHDQVLVTPAPGQPGRLPFWKGDTLGRPVELGRALGAFIRELGGLSPAQARARVMAAGLDDWAADNLLAYLDEQRAGHRPPARRPHHRRRAVPRRARRLAGRDPLAVRRAGARAVGAGVAARLRERYGVDVQAMHADDGIVLRLPDIELDEDEARRATGTEMAVVEPDEVEPLVTAEVGGSALFASRFRECAARALLLPRRNPGRRTPLWQQRQRSAQLLSVASDYGSFPIVLETMRECLQDVFDVPGLVGLMREVEARTVRFVEVETQQPSPFARSLLFGYVAQFLYEGDSPLAERRAAALSLDSTLLAELLGHGLRRAARAARPRRRRRAGPRPAAAVRGPAGPRRRGRRRPAAGARPAQHRRGGRARRAARPGWPSSRRPAAPSGCGSPARSAGSPSRTPAGCATRSAPRCRSASPRPSSSRCATRSATWSPATPAPTGRSRGRRRAPARPRRAVVEQALPRLAGAGRVVDGEFLPGGAGPEWCDAEVLRTLRRRSLAALRKEVEPVPVEALASFLPAWQQVGGRLRGAEGVLRVVEQLQGAQVPASALERWCCRSRVAGYSPALLDELSAAGEVLWPGHGALPGDDGWVSLHLADTAPLTLPAPDDGRDQQPAAPGGPRRAGRRRRLLLPAARRRRPESTDDARLWSPRCGTSSGPATSATTPWRRCAPSSPAAAPTRRAAPRPAAATAAAGRRCPAAPARRSPPAAGRCCPRSRPTRPGGRTRWPRCCSTGTAW